MRYLQRAYGSKVMQVRNPTEAEGLELESAFLLSRDCSVTTVEDFYSPVLLVALVEVGIPDHRPGNAGVLLCL